jgi:plastocyanin
MLLRRTFLAAGAAGGLLPASVRTAPAAGDAQVTIGAFSFSPAELSVAAGTRVTWTNRDDIPHALASSDDPRRMRSPPLDTGDSFAFTFDQPGIYRYVCSMHPHMQGMVTVR